MMELYSVFQMSQDKMTPMIAFGIPLKVEIPSQEHWLSTWPITIQFKGLVWYGHACGVIPRGKRLSLSLDFHAAVFEAEIFVILTCSKECIGRVCTGGHIYICCDNLAALWALEPSRVTSKFVWEC
jgi:hypothetical protein